MSQLPVFETARLILRNIIERDAPAYERHFIDYEVIGTMSHMVPWPYPENGVLEYIRTVVIARQCKDQWTWGICLRSEPHELIGAIWLKRKDTPSNRGLLAWETILATRRHDGGSKARHCCCIRCI